MKNDRLKQSIKTAKAWAKVHLKDPIVNKETGWPIEVSITGIDHTLVYDLRVERSGRYIDLLSLVRKLKPILRDMHTATEVPNKHGENGVIIHKFQYQTEIKGNVENLEIVVKETITDKKLMIKRRMFYNHKFVIEDIKKTP
jgi:hypothetical protein